MWPSSTPLADPATTAAPRLHSRPGWVMPSQTWLISAMTGKDRASAIPQTNMMASPRAPFIACEAMVWISETG